MSSPRRAVCLLALLALLAAGTAQAQVDLGELLDLGGRKLGPPEVRALGETLLRRETANEDSQVTLRADGTVVGMVHNKQGHGSSEAVGQWRVDADGLRCIEVALPAFRMDRKQCSYLFRLGQDIFFAPSDADRSVAVVLHAR
jgi:hypothetical protein